MEEEEEEEGRGRREEEEEEEEEGEGGLITCPSPILLPSPPPPPYNSLAWNNIGGNGAVTFWDAIGANTSLKTLDMAFNSLGNALVNDAVKALARALTINVHLRHLDLSFNHL